MNPLRLHAMIKDAISDKFVFQNADFYHQLASESNFQMWKVKLGPNGGDQGWIVFGECFDDHVVGLLQVLNEKVYENPVVGKIHQFLTL